MNAVVSINVYFPEFFELNLLKYHIFNRDNGIFFNTLLFPKTTSHLKSV